MRVCVLTVVNSKLDFLYVWSSAYIPEYIYCTVMCISCQYLLQPLTSIELCTMASVMPNYGWMPSVASGCCKNRVSGSCLVKYKYKPLLVSWCAECCIVHTVRGFKRNKQTNRQMATGDLQIRYVPSHFANKLLWIGIFSAIITLFYSEMEAKTLSNGMGLQ